MDLFTLLLLTLTIVALIVISLIARPKPMNSRPLAGLMIACAFALVASIAFSGCQQQGGVKEQRAQQERIAAACTGITVAGNAIALNAEMAAPGEAKDKAKALAAKALAIAKPTKTFCQPKPAAYLSSADYAVLLGAAADLALEKEKVP